MLGTFLLPQDEVKEVLETDRQERKNMKRGEKGNEEWVLRIYRKDK
jgi:hypothetical protein